MAENKSNAGRESVGYMTVDFWACAKKTIVYF